MTRREASQYVKMIGDDAGNFRKLGDDPHAFIREVGDGQPEDFTGIGEKFKYPTAIVLFEDGVNEPFGVGVHSYLDVELNDSEVKEIAIDGVDEFFPEVLFGASVRVIR